MGPLLVLASIAAVIGMLSGIYDFNTAKTIFQQIVGTVELGFSFLALVVIMGAKAICDKVMEARRPLDRIIEGGPVRRTPFVR